jgi:hypothetical protein
MKNIIFILIFFANMLYGVEYNKLLLQAQSTIYPKVMLLDKQLPHKLIEGKIVLAIVYDNGDYEAALYAKKSIEQKFHGTIGGYPYEVKIMQCPEFSRDAEVTAVYILASS